jgi:hypothetical protein
MWKEQVGKPIPSEKKLGRGRRGGDSGVRLMEQLFPVTWVFLQVVDLHSV